MPRVAFQERERPLRRPEPAGGLRARHESDVAAGREISRVTLGEQAKRVTDAAGIIGSSAAASSSAGRSIAESQGPALERS